MISKIVFIIFLFFSTAAFSAEITYLLGKVEVIKSVETTLSAQRGTHVSFGDKVKTYEKSIAIIKLDHGRNIKLNANSLALIQKPSATKSAVVLLKGSIFAKIPLKKKKTPFNMRMKSLVMGVRGTEFFASFGAEKKQNQDLWICVNQGKVEVTHLESQKSFLVKEGEGIFVHAGENLTQPKPYEWTKNLNWNMNPQEGTIENKVQLDELYMDLLDQDYD